MDAPERVEVAIRAAMTDHVSTTHEDPHWYVEPTHFHNSGKNAGLLTMIRDTSEARLLGAPE